LEERWCPASEYFQWKSTAAGVWSNIGNWNESHDDINWFPAVIPPGSQPTDVAQFDGTGTGTCTVDTGVSIQTLKMMVGGNGSDQLVLDSPLSAQMSWTADGVQININGSFLTCEGGNIKSFVFTGAKGTFVLAMSGSGTTTWNTTANSTTTSQIRITGGVFDLQGTGSITSTYRDRDVYVFVGATLKFDYGNNAIVGDLFDNGNDNAGYIYLDYDGNGNGGIVTTTANTFQVTNKMPIRTNGSVTVDTGQLSFKNSVPGSSGTNGVSYYQTPANIQASTTVLHGGLLGTSQGFRQDSGSFFIGAGGAKISAVGTGTSVDFEGGWIKFPTSPSVDYETLEITSGFLRLSATTVNMKINGGNSNAGQFDQIVCDAGSITITNRSVLNVTVNYTLTKGKSWPLLVSKLGTGDIAGDFTSITPGNTFTDAIRDVGATTVWFLLS
jgi:hypothetical protein